MRRLLLKIVSFSITFLIGAFAASLFISPEIPTNVRQNTQIGGTLFDPPEPAKCDPESLDNLTARSRAIKDWIKNHPNAAKDKPEAKSKEDLDLERRIIEITEQLKRLEKPKSADEMANDLLYRCDEDKWKNPKQEN